MNPTDSTPAAYRFVTYENAMRYEDGNGNVAAEVTFPDMGNNTVDINHTYVDNALRGQGIAGQLLKRAAEAIEGTGRKARPTCSYAVRWFSTHPEWEHLVA